MQEVGGLPGGRSNQVATVAIKRAAELRNMILLALKNRAYRPIELLHQLQTPEVTESALKDELAELINAGVIELSPDRHIRLREPLSATR
jgi:hypothetical protein